MMTPSGQPSSATARALGPFPPTSPLQHIRRSRALASFGACSRYASFMWVALTLTGCTDFPGDPARTVSVQQPSDALWPSELSVKDTILFAVDVEDEDGSRITGLGVQWQSSDPSVLEVRSLVPTGATRDTALLAQLSVQIVAQRRGEATISVEVVQPGITATVLSRTIRVMEHWTSVSAGFTHSCGITIDHDAFCWGSGFLGNGSVAGSPKPVPVSGGLKFASVTAGDGHSCGVLLDGTVQCWGSNTNGALGTGAAGDQALPATVSLVSTFATVVAGDNYVCGVSGEMAAYCWGDNDRWELGDARVIAGRPVPPFDNCGIGSQVVCSRTPRRIRDRVNIPLVLSSIAPGVSHTCALSPSGAAICWGRGSVELGSAVEVTTTSSGLDCWASAA